MKTIFKYLIPVVILVFISGLWLHAQVIVTSGSSLVIVQFGKFVTTQNVVLHNGGNLIVNGTLNLKKDLVNQNVSIDNLGPGAVEFTGSVNQLITGPNVMEDVLVNNVAGLTVGSHTSVNGAMTLSSGKVTLGSSNLSLGPNATFPGSPSESAMIVPTGSGQLIKAFTSGFTGVFTFPVGDNTMTPEYSPVTLSFTQMSAWNIGFTGVNLLNEKYPDPLINGNYLKRFWTITGDQFQSFNCNAIFQYTPADVVGREKYLSCTKVNPVPWVTYSMTDSTSHLLTATGLTSFSSFTGVKSTNTPANNELANISIGSGVVNCYDATEVLTVAGSGRTFMVQNGGSVTLIAGQKISMLPGTKVFSGGYLHAFITTTSNYCGSQPAPVVSNPDPGNDAVAFAVPEITEGRHVRVYPNPASNLFTVGQTGDDRTGMTRIEILNLNGLKMKSEILHGEMKYQGSVSGFMPGIYFIKVFTGNFVETLKLVKN
jgi:hypothetical protein